MNQPTKKRKKSVKTVHEVIALRVEYDEKGKHLIRVRSLIPMPRYQLWGY